MLRNVSLVSIYIGVLLLTVGSTQAAQYGTAEDAKAMLGRAIAAVKQDEANALDRFNKGDGGFKDRDLYVLCANVSDGIITAHPIHKGGQLKDFPRGQEVMRTATEGKVSEITYWWPRPGSRLRNTPFTRRSEIRFAASATTSEHPRGPTRRMGWPLQ